MDAQFVKGVLGIIYKKKSKLVLFITLTLRGIDES